MSKHKHASLMLLYAIDAGETSKPWRRWQQKPKGGFWVDCKTNPSWEEDYSYRRITELSCARACLRAVGLSLLKH